MILLLYLFLARRIDGERYALCALAQAHSNPPPIPVEVFFVHLKIIIRPKSSTSSRFGCTSGEDSICTHTEEKSLLL